MIPQWKNKIAELEKIYTAKLNEANRCPRDQIPQIYDALRKIGADIATWEVKIKQEQSAINRGYEENRRKREGGD